MMGIPDMEQVLILLFLYYSLNLIPRLIPPAKQNRSFTQKIGVISGRTANTITKSAKNGERKRGLHKKFTRFLAICRAFCLRESAAVWYNKTYSGGILLSSYSLFAFNRAYVYSAVKKQKINGRVPGYMTPLARIAANGGNTAKRRRRLKDN